MPLYSLKTKLIGMILLVGLVIGMVTLLAFQKSSQKIIQTLAMNFAVKEAQLEKNKILAIIDRELVLTEKMTDDNSIKRWVLAEGNQELKEEAFTALESYRRLYRDKSFFIALKNSNRYYVYNKNIGHERVEIVQLDPHKSDDKWFYEGLRTIDNYALNLDYNPTLKVAKVWFNAIMRDSKGEKIGICGGGISITDFLDEIIHANDKGYSTILIDQSGVIQAHADRTIVEHNANTREAAKKMTIFSLLKEPQEIDRLNSAMKSLATGHSGMESFPVKISGKEYLLAISSLEGIGWLNVVLVDVSRVLSMQEFLPILLTISLALLLATLIISFLINKMVLYPLTRLADASREVAGGRYSVTLPVKSQDELGALTNSFNSMTATIRDYTDNLEKKVQERTDELADANNLLVDSQQRIMASISYAQMIQSAILPDLELRERVLGENSVIYRPKEQVGGDFYYLREFPDYVLLGVIDCTGHGIPGAFMTMTVHSVLNHVVDRLGGQDPALILAELNKSMRQTLKMKEIDAGLDIGLCLIDRKGGRLVYAAAGLSLFIATAKGFLEIKGNHQRIGYKGSNLDYRYDNQEILLSTGDVVHLPTDGLLDEPGGEKGYGFGAERLKTVLAEISGLPMSAQKKYLEETLKVYRGEHSQRDDVTLIAFRI